MAGDLTIDYREQTEGTRWGIMLAVSIILHLSVFSAAVFIPGLSPSRGIDNIVYEVDLVDMPSLVQDRPSSAKSSGTKEADIKTDSSAKRIAATEDKKSAEVEKISISKKKTSSKKQESAKTEKNTKTDDAAHLSKAISEIREKTASEESHLNKALSKIQDKVGVRGGTESGSGA